MRFCYGFLNENTNENNRRKKTIRLKDSLIKNRENCKICMMIFRIVANKISWIIILSHAHIFLPINLIAEVLKRKFNKRRVQRVKDYKKIIFFFFFNKTKYKMLTYCCVLNISPKKIFVLKSK